MKRNVSISQPFVVVQLLTALFLITLGIQGLVEYNSDWNQFWRGVNHAFGGDNAQVLAIIISILELASGVVVLLALFRIGNDRIVRILTLIVIVFWLLRIIYYYVFNGFLEPSFILWLNRISLELLVTAVLWMINRRYGGV
jgi:uncharacterized membrane protein YphA (DoxX/SURF4 family)